jgi:hypothetical protein
MPRLFISHSSKDNFEAIAFRDWLEREGWTPEDIFLDLHDIGAGARWKEALARANERCEAVVLLASPASLASNECRLEIRMAEDYGKQIIVAILYLLTPADDALEPYRERQIVDLGLEPRDASFTVEHNGQTKAITFSTRTLRHIKARLDQLGISPTSFTWRPKDLGKASPYPGLESFSRGEAALFFGRAGDIARGLAELRKLRRLGAGQIMLIEAASGAGKSSYLKAGLWPRLERDPEFLPVAVLRPATGILSGDSGLGRQLSVFFAAHRQTHTAASIHQALRGDIEAAADTVIGLLNEATAIGHAIQTVARPDASLPTPLIAVDQAEELFAAADAEESHRFIDLIARILDPERSAQRPDVPKLEAPPILLWTIRADSLDAMLHAADVAGLKPPQPFLLPPIPRDAYREIIEAPIAVANQAGMRIAIDPLLTDALVKASTGAGRPTSTGLHAAPAHGGEPVGPSGEPHARQLHVGRRHRGRAEEAPRRGATRSRRRRRRPEASRHPPSCYLGRGGQPAGSQAPHHRRGPASVRQSRRPQAARRCTGRGASVDPRGRRRQPVDARSGARGAAAVAADRGLAG